MTKYKQRQLIIQNSLFIRLLVDEDMMCGPAQDDDLECHADGTDEHALDDDGEGNTAASPPAKSQSILHTTKSMNTDLPLSPLVITLPLSPPSFRYRRIPI